MSITVYPFYGSGGGADLAAVATSGAYSDLTGRPTLGTAAATDATAYATAAQGSKADTAIQPGLSSYFAKADPAAVAWSVTGANALQTAMALHVEVNGLIVARPAGTAIVTPATPVTGTDYAIWCHPDGTLKATDSHLSPPIANARKLGGYHYAPGGNAPAQAGGNTTPAINPYSCWDLKWRPACLDPRCMTLAANHFWVDIYFANTDPDANGTSRFGVTIADGSSPPKIPAALGGDGSTTYGSLTWFEANSLLAAYGKRAPTYAEFMVLAFGVTEATSFGSYPPSTALDAPRTSRWGVMQATGGLWAWGSVQGGPYGSAVWTANTEGFGSTYNLPSAALFGGDGNNGADSGSRCSRWGYSPSTSSASFAVRAVSDHLQLA